MLLRLLRDFIQNCEAGIGLFTVFLYPVFIIQILVGYDLGRYFMLTRLVASATEQTAQTITMRGVNDGEDANLIAKTIFEARMGSNIVTTPDGNGLISTSVTFTHEPDTDLNRLVVKTNYNLLLSKLISSTAILWPQVYFLFHRTTFPMHARLRNL